MGGKRKQAQRTKDNAKPSNSGRSAALLTSTSSHVPKFGAVNDCGFVPIFSGLPASLSEDFDARIDSNFQLVLKKMNKKDSTTRLKALQEFASLVESSELDAVKAVLPFWPRLYCILAGDLDHRVREAVQEAHRTIAVRTKKNLAPYLRQVAGPWFAAQFDTYPPVGTAATRALKDAFPANKLVEAVMFCRDEILKYISENLLGLTVQSTNSAKNGSDDKLKARQQRIVISCLQAFAEFLRLVPAEQLCTVAGLPAVENLVANKQFWLLASDNLPAVRSAWMCVLTVLLERMPQVVDAWHSPVVSAVLGRLDDADPCVLPYVWEAALQVFSKIQDWESLSNKDRQILPPLWKMLKEAGNGSAASIFPNLLPVLSCLLKTCQTPALQEALCDKFFASLREGFAKKNMLLSRAESEAIAKCYMECVRYISSTNVCPPQTIVEKHLLPAVELNLAGGEVTLLSKAVFEQTSSLVRNWSLNQTDSHCTSMLHYFWEGLHKFFNESIVSSGAMSLSTQVQLCLSLNSPKKCSKTVNFEGNNVEKKNPSADESLSEDFKSKLLDLVHCLCTLYLAKLKDTKQSCFLIPLSKLVSTFVSAEFVERLTPGDNLNEMLNFIRGSWMSLGDTEKRAALDLVFCWVPHLKAEEQVPVLWSLFEEEDLMLWLVKVARVHYSEPYVSEWLTSARLREYLLACTRELSSSHSKNFLRECVSITEDTGVLVGWDTTSTIFEELCSLLSRNTDEVEFVAELVLAVCITLECSNVKVSMTELVCSLFHFCCQFSNRDLPESSNIPSAWQEGLNTLVGMEDPLLIPLLLNRFCISVKEQLSVKKVLSVKVINHMAEVVEDAIFTMASDPESMASLLSIFARSLEPELGTWESKAMKLCEDIERMLGTTGMDPVVPRPQEDHSDVPIPDYINYSFFSFLLLTRIGLGIDDAVCSENKVSSGDEDCSALRNAVGQPEGESQCPSLPDQGSPSEDTEECQKSSGENITRRMVIELQDSLVHAACFMVFCRTFHLHHKSVAYYSYMAPHYFIVQKKFNTMIKVLQSCGLNSILESIADEVARGFGGMWVHIRCLVTGSGRLHEAFEALRKVGRSDCAAQTLAPLSSVQFKPSMLDERPLLATLTRCLRFHRNDSSETFGNLVVAALEKWPELDHGQLLRDCDVSTEDPSEVLKVCEMMHAAAACVCKCPHLLTPKLWDFILVSVPYYVLSLVNNQPQLIPEALGATTLQPVENVVKFTMATCSLFCELERHVQKVLKEVDTEFLERAHEWEAVFASEVHQAFLTLFVRIAKYIEGNKPSILGHLLIKNISAALLQLHQVHLTLKSELVKEPVAYTEAIEIACRIIHCSVQPLQVTAYSLLTKSLPWLVEADNLFVSSMLEADDAVETIANVADLKIEPLFTHLLKTKTVVDIILADFKFGDTTCVLQPHSDSHHYTTAYLLLWNLLLEACSQAGSLLRYHYTSIIKNNGSLDSLLHHVFLLMPGQVLELKPSQSLSVSFNTSPPMRPGRSCTSRELSHWACYVYFNALRRLPAMVRQWWVDTKSKVNALVQQVTLLYVSPLLCQDELQSIQTNTGKLKNMKVKVHVKAREVVATYAVDDTRLELVITLPDIYPLGMVQVQSNSPAVGTGHRRNWSRLVTVFLTHQNGSVYDGLLLWKSNLDKRFDGVEECYICFSVLHGTNFQMPKLCCKTCKKKFHSPCLYKWFSTSNKSTCPICRNIF